MTPQEMFDKAVTGIKKQGRLSQGTPVHARRQRVRGDGVSRLRAFLLGVQEFRLSITTCLDDGDLSEAYDSGREWAHRLTFRRYEP